MHLDLNLLAALDALLEEGSVTGAADRMHVTAPAMSRTLGRIRHTTKDQILVRTGRTMTPTPYALAVRAEVHRLVQQVEAVLAPESDLDLAMLDRTFTLLWHDAITTAIGPALLAAVHAEAPRARLRFLAESHVDTNGLRHGEVDLQIGADQPERPEITWETAAHDRLVVALRAGHPLAAGRLTLSRYVKASHLTVSRRGRLHDPIDDLLAARGLDRRVVASAPTIAAALRFIGDSDLLVAVPDRMTSAMRDALGLRSRPLPVEPPPVPVILAWHQRYDDDRAHTWLRGQVRTILASGPQRPADRTPH